MKKVWPSVSAIIPMFNTGRSAEKLVNSLLEDNGEELEIIVVDDGSTDDSYNRLEKLAKKDARVQLVRQKNAGAASARNTGIERARGEFLFFFDSDDEVKPGMIEEMAEAMRQNTTTPLVVSGVQYRKLKYGTDEAVYTTPRRKRRKTEGLGDYILYLMILDGRMYSVINKVFRAEIIRKEGLKFETGRDFAEDTHFVLRYLMAARKYVSGEIQFIPKPFYIYNFGTETSTVKSSGVVWANWQKSYQDLERSVKKLNDGKITLKTRGLLTLIRLRWRISYLRAKRRSS